MTSKTTVCALFRDSCAWVNVGLCVWKYEGVIITQSADKLLAPHCITKRHDAAAARRIQKERWKWLKIRSHHTLMGWSQLPCVRLLICQDDGRTCKEPTSGQLRTGSQSLPTKDTLGLDYSKISVWFYNSWAGTCRSAVTQHLFTLRNEALMRPWRTALIAFAIPLCM